MTDRTLREAFASALRGANGRVVQLPHPKIVFLAQNLDGRAALLAKVEIGPDEQISDGKGFTVTTSRSSSGSFVRLSANEAGTSLLFLKLVEYVMERTEQAHSSTEAVKRLVAAIDEFRRFFQRKPGRLREEQIRGLVAELTFIAHLLEVHSEQARDIFYSWGGPFDALHDFTFSDGRAVEVKSAHRPASEIRVSSNDQLTTTEDGLDLIVLPLEKVSAISVADVSFVELVKRVGSAAMSSGATVAELWENALVALGLDIDDEYYDQWKFIYGDWLRFDVNTSFPKIDNKHIPQGIVKISYGLRIEDLKEFQMEFSEIEVPL